MPLIIEPIRTPVVLGSNSASTSVTGTTETSLFPTAVGTKVVPAGWFQPGHAARLTIRGIMSTALTPGITTFRLKVNGTTVAGASTASLLASVTNASFVLTDTFQCYSVGATGVFGIAGDVRYPTGLLGAQMASLPLFSTSTALDTTGALGIDATVTHSATGNNIMGITALLELLPQAVTI